MQAGLSPRDRKLLLGTGAILLVMLAATIGFAPPANDEMSGLPSTYSSSAGGARAAYLLLQDLGYPLYRWEESPLDLSAPSRAILILAEPSEKPSAREAAALLRFVEQGGRVLFSGGAIRSFFPAAPAPRSSSDLAWRTFPAQLPSRYTRGAQRVEMRLSSSWASLGPSQLALYSDAGSTVVVAWRVGEGEILWWGAATPLTNAGIKRSGNLTLFLNALSTGAAEERRTIYWDEYFHGQRGSLWAYVARTPVAWGLLQTALLAAAAMFTFSRRSGPVVAPAGVSRLSPLEFVETLGGLYQRAGATSVAVGVSYRRLRFKLARRLGVPTSTPDATLAQAAGERLGWNGAQLLVALEQAALREKTRPGRALALIQNLESFTLRLRVSKSILLEKN